MPRAAMIRLPAIMTLVESNEKALSINALIGLDRDTGRDPRGWINRSRADCAARTTPPLPVPEIRRRGDLPVKLLLTLALLLLRSADPAVLSLGSAAVING